MENKGILILNLVIAFLIVISVFNLIDLSDSFKHVRERKAENEAHAGYDVSGRNYEDIVDWYYSKRTGHPEPEKGYEDLYLAGEYCHRAFMLKVYEAEQNEAKISRTNEKLKSLRAEMGSISYVVDDVDEIIGVEKNDFSERPQ